MRGRWVADKLPTQNHLSLSAVDGPLAASNSSSSVCILATLIGQRSNAAIQVGLRFGSAFGW